MSRRRSERTNRRTNCAGQSQPDESVIMKMSYKLPSCRAPPTRTRARLFEPPPPPTQSNSTPPQRRRHKTGPLLLPAQLVLLGLTQTLNQLQSSGPLAGALVGASGVAPTIDYSHNMRVLKLPKSTRPGEIIYRLRASDGDQNDRLHFGVIGLQGRALVDIVQAPGSWKEADVYLRHPLEVPLDLEGAESKQLAAGSNRHQNHHHQLDHLQASASTAAQLDDPLYTAVYNLTIFVADASNKTTQIQSTVLVTNDDLLESEDQLEEQSEGANYETSSTIADDLQEQTKYLQQSGTTISQLASSSSGNSSLISRLPLGFGGGGGSTRAKPASGSHRQHRQQPAQLSPFIRPRHVFAVAENGQIGESIGFLTVRDSDKSDLPVRFELRGQGADHFNIRYVFGPRGQSRAELVLSQRVDYERQNLFRLKVLALNAWTNVKYDTRNVATLDIVVTVGDVQDTPPHFKRLPRALLLSSQTRPGDLVARLEAEDGDYADQRPVGFALDADSPLSSFFTIDKLSGELRLARAWQELALQQQSLMVRLAAAAAASSAGQNFNVPPPPPPLLAGPWPLQLTVFASELPDTTSYDHLWPPMFARAELPLQLVDLVNEPPQLVGGLLTETSGVGGPTGLTVPTLRAFVREFANGDRPSEELAQAGQSAVSSEGSWPSGQLVQWYISKNHSAGNEPTAGSSTAADSPTQLAIQLAEASRGRPLVVDFGQGSNGTFEMSLEGPDAHLFELEPSHPVNRLSLFNLFVSPNANRSLFDFDSNPATASASQRLGLLAASATGSEPPARSFHVEIVARDFGLVQRQTMRVKCLIDLVDINDNAPQFDQDLYTFSIFENAQLGQILGSIRARDLDRLGGIAGVLSGQYQRVRYTALTGRDSHLFHLEPESGLITLEGALDRERQDHYLLLAEARDMSGQAANYTKILVNVLDVNDNAPIFSQSHYDAVLLPDGTFHQPLVVSAADSDEPSSANSQVAYEIIAGNQNEQFAIDALSGAIYPTGNQAAANRPLQLPSILSEPILPYSIRTAQHGGAEHNTHNKPDQHGKILPLGPSHEIEETTAPANARGSHNHQQQQSPLRLNWPRSIASPTLETITTTTGRPATGPVQRGFGHTLDRDGQIGRAGQQPRPPQQQQPFDASKVPPVTTLVVRAHDFGIPLRSATCKVNIYNQALLSRSLSVILNGTAEQLEQRRDLIERSFGALTGSRVHIESIDALSESSSISVARLRLAIPAGHSLVDLTDLSALMTAIDYKQAAAAASCPPGGQAQNLDQLPHPIHYITTGDRIYPVHHAPISGNISAGGGGGGSSSNTANTAIFADFSPLDNAASQLERKLLFYIIIVGICILALLVIWMVYFCCREDQQQQRRRLKSVESLESSNRGRGHRGHSNRGIQAADSLEEGSLEFASGKRAKGASSNAKAGSNLKSSSRTHLIGEDEQQQQLAMGRSASQLDLDEQQRQSTGKSTLVKTPFGQQLHAIGNNLLKQQNQLPIPSNIKPEHYSMYNGQVWFEQGGLRRQLAPSGTDQRPARLGERRASSAPSVGARSLDSGLHAIINGTGRLSAISPVPSGLNTPPNQRGQFFPNTLGYTRNLANIGGTPTSGSALIYPTSGSGGQRQRNFLGARSRGRVVPMSMVGRGGGSEYTNEAFEPVDFESAPGGGGLVMVPLVAAAAGHRQATKARHRNHHHHRSSNQSTSSSSRSDSTRTLDEEDEELDHESVLLDSDQELLGFDSTGTPIIATRTRQKAPETAATSYLLPPAGGGPETASGGTGASSPAATVINVSPAAPVKSESTAAAAGGAGASLQRAEQKQENLNGGNHQAKGETKVARSQTEAKQKSEPASSKSMDLMSELSERLNSANKQRALRRQGADDDAGQQSEDAAQQRAAGQVIDQRTRTGAERGATLERKQQDEPSSLVASERGPIGESSVDNGAQSTAVVAKPAADGATATANETGRRQAAFAGRRASDTISCQSRSTISETASELTNATNAVDSREGRLSDMKNGELLEKQSIFALTYSGLATDKLPS